MSGDADHRAARHVYDATADAYVAFAGTRIGPPVETGADLALLVAWAEQARAAGPGPVGDLGCGSGRVAATLATAGIDAVGVDLSVGLLRHARRTNATVPVVAGSLVRLPLREASLAGAVAWYSIIHTPRSGINAIAAELARVVRPGGPVLLAFQAGRDEAVRREDAHGTGITLTSHHHDPAAVAGALDAHGIVVTATVVREAELDHERTPQAFVAGRVRSRP